MDRRLFLKGVAVLASGLILPDFKILLPEEIIKPNELWFSTVRESRAYHISTDQFLYRWDLLGTDRHNKITQLHVNIPIATQQMRESKSFIDDARKEAAKALLSGMNERGIDPTMLVPLESVMNKFYM